MHSDTKPESWITRTHKRQSWAPYAQQCFIRLMTNLWRETIQAIKFIYFTPLIPPSDQKCMTASNQSSPATVFYFPEVAQHIPTIIKLPFRESKHNYHLPEFSSKSTIYSVHSKPNDLLSEVISISPFAHEDSVIPIISEARNLKRNDRERITLANINCFSWWTGARGIVSKTSALTVCIQPVEEGNTLLWHANQWEAVLQNCTIDWI